MAIKRFSGGVKKAPGKSKAPAASKFKRSSRDEDDDDEDQDDEEEESDEDDEDDEDERPARSSKKSSKKAPAKKGGSKKGGRWGGLGFGNQKEGDLVRGKYVVKVGPCTLEPSKKDRRNEWFVAHVEIVDASKKSELSVGAKRVVKACVSTDPGAAEMVRFIGTAAGAESEDDYRERFDDESGTLIESVVNCGEDSPIFGRFLRIEATDGKEDGNGGFYPQYQFSVVDEDEQEVEAPEGNG